MSESAFGVEHGEVSKAFGSAFKPPKMGAPNPSKAFQAGQQAKQKVKSGAKQAKSGVGMTGMAAGQGASAAGQSMQNKPFRTGAAILGGGGTALTGGIYANRKKPNGQK